MIIDLVLLAYSTSSDEGIDEGGKSRPPEILFQKCFGVELSCMSSGGGVIYGTDNGLSFVWRNVHATFEV